MKTLKNISRFLMILCFMLMLSSATFAQRYGGRHGGYRGGYYGGRPHVSIGIGINPYYGYNPVFRPRAYYHPGYRLPYAYPHYGPAFGLRIGVLPFGYSQFYIGGNPYYYYDGIYYQPYASGGYTVAPPPLGAMVKHLPSGAKLTVIDGQKYYVLGGTFYQQRTTSNNKVRYEVVGTDGVLNTANVEAEGDENGDAQQVPPPPAANNSKNTPAPADGSVVNQLPSGSTAVIISQQKYYLSPAGVYYEEMIDGNNKVTYKVAGNTSNETKPNTDTSGT